MEDQDTKNQPAAPAKPKQSQSQRPAAPPGAVLPGRASINRKAVHGPDGPPARQPNHPAERAVARLRDALHLSPNVDAVDVINEAADRLSQEPK